MKNFFRVLVIEVVAIAAFISGLITILCLIGFVINIDYDVAYILLFSTSILILSITYLRIKKVTWEEFTACLWLGLPW